MTQITDAFGRTFKTLRVSLIDTCNFACVYCVDPTQGGLAIPKDQERPLLSIGQYLNIIKKMHNQLDLTAIRLTGGEPTLYRQLIPLIEGIKNLGISEIKMTSNGYLLANKSEALKNAGLTSVNISLDAIEPEVFLAINKRQNLNKVLQGIEACLKLGIEVKINTVVMKGINDSQITGLFNYCKERNISIRFLELMQMGHLNGNFEQHFFAEENILQIISSYHQLKSFPRDPGATAKYWITEDGFKFGIISNVSDPFCDDCNRLRLDSYGNIFGCLSSNNALNISGCIDNDAQTAEQLKKALNQKQRKFSGSALSMMHIGG